MKSSLKKKEKYYIVNHWRQNMLYYIIIKIAQITRCRISMQADTIQNIIWYVIASALRKIT